MYDIRDMLEHASPAAASVHCINRLWVGASYRHELGQFYIQDEMSNAGIVSDVSKSSASWAM